MGKALILVLGGARSGKSNYAQRLAGEVGHRVLYVATATVGDEEMAERIAHHRAARPSHWHTLEIPTNVGQVLEAKIADAEVVILDCLTLLVSNLMMGLDEMTGADILEARVQAELDALIRVYEAHSATFIIVSNEVGMGIVPAYPLGRVYRDVLGKANQWLAMLADRVILMVAGLPLVIKGPVSGIYTAMPGGGRPA